jgi:hypothetical protein
MARWRRGSLAVARARPDGPPASALSQTEAVGLSKAHSGVGAA